MKNIALLFFLLLLNSLIAQEYTPMLEVGKIWNMERHIDTGSFYPYNIEITESINRNGYTYYRVQSINNCEILLREDVIEKKIYRLINNEDILMFDFSLEVGDVIPNNFSSIFIIDPTLIVSGIGDFFGMNDLHYFDFTIDPSPYYQRDYTEGIGLRSGIIYCFDNGCFGSIYEVDRLVGINNILNTNDFFIQNSIDVFYNSKTKVLKLLNNSEEVHLNLFTILGHKVIDTDMVNQKYLPNLNSGIYIYLISKGQSIKTGKILVD